MIKDNPMRVGDEDYAPYRPLPIEDEDEAYERERDRQILTDRQKICELLQGIDNLEKLVADITTLMGKVRRGTE